MNLHEPDETQERSTQSLEVSHLGLRCNVLLCHIVCCVLHSRKMFSVPSPVQHDMRPQDFPSSERLQQHKLCACVTLDGFPLCYCFTVCAQKQTSHRPSRCCDSQCCIVNKSARCLDCNIYAGSDTGCRVAALGQHVAFSCPTNDKSQRY